MLAFLCLVMLVFIPDSAARGAELNVGQKVVYPGANGGPPLEKDVGTHLKVNVISAETPSAAKPVSRQERLQEMLDTGSNEAILTATRGRNDGISSGFRALAQEQLQHPAAARSEALTALKDPGLPEDLRDDMMRIVESIAPATASQAVSPGR